MAEAAQYREVGERLTVAIPGQTSEAFVKLLVADNGARLVRVGKVRSNGYESSGVSFPATIAETLCAHIMQAAARTDSQSKTAKTRGRPKGSKNQPKAEAAETESSPLESFTPEQIAMIKSLLG